MIAATTMPHLGYVMLRFFRAFTGEEEGSRRPDNHGIAPIARLEVKQQPGVLGWSARPNGRAGRGFFRHSKTGGGLRFNERGPFAFRLQA
jgi:hypothetical protein